MAEENPEGNPEGSIPLMQRLKALLDNALDFASLAVPLGIVAVVVMLVIPLPTFLLDILMSCNIALGLVVVISSTYVREALEFSVFPSLLLVTTLARLALNVSSTRLILLEGKDFDGEVVKAFGDFVVGGNYVVGIIIFAILVLIQFMVITKGSERVAEVAARFTLDAMPGKQMAIDADLNAGIIDEDGARERREKIADEADFFGAMDGASKFVKGDTIAGIIITVINVVGGIIIGYFSGQFDGIAEIASTYTLLTVGDGLVSIVPSLLISVATGIVVTKSNSKKDLGGEVIAQLVSKPKALLISSGVFLLFAIIPGLPKVPFFLLSTVLGFLAFTLGDGLGMLKKEDGEGADGAPDKGGGKSGGATPAASAAEGEEGEGEDSGPEDVSSLLQVDTLEMEIGYGLIPMVDPNQGGDLLNRVKMIRRQVAMELGLVVPAVRIRDNMQLPPNKYSIKLKGIEIGDGEIYVDRFLAMDPGMVKQRVDGLETVEPAFNLKALWIEDATREEAEYNGYTVVDAPSVVATHLTELIKRHSGEILGRQEAKLLVEKIKEQSPAVVEAAVPENDTQRLGHLQKVLQALLKEGVSIRNLAGILESFADIMSPEVTSIDAVVEYVRVGLARQITREYTTEDNVLKVITLEPGLEQQFVDTIQRTSTIHQALDPDSANELFQRVNAAVEELLVQGISPVLLCSPVIRLHFKRLVERVAPQLVVLSFNEIVTDVEIDNVQVIALGDGGGQ
jgi:flagellar biosynthesis protein FlhA